MTLFYILIAVVIGFCFFKCHIALAIAVTTIFILFSFFRISKKKSLIFGAVILSCALISKIDIKNNPKDNIYKGIVIESKENYFIFGSGFEKFYIYEKDNNREVGDILIVASSPSEIKMTSYESRFDFKNYLSNKGINRALTSYKIESIISNPLRFKAYKNKFLANFDEETKNLIDCMLFANVNYDSTLSILTNKLNNLSFLVTSGIYFNFIVIIFKKIFSLLTKEKLSEILPYVCLFPYGLFVFQKIGIQRVFVLGIAKYLNKFIFKSKFSYLNILTFCAFLFILFDYHNIYQSSFYIGFGLSFFLYFSRLYLNKFNKKKKNIFSIILIQLFLLPLTCFSNGLFLPLNIFLNQLLIVFNQIFFIASYISFVSTFPFVNVLSFLSKVVYKAIDLFSSLYISFPIGELFLDLIPLYYISLFFLVYLFEVGRKKHAFISKIPILTTFLCSFIPFSHLENAIYFINVGQGDSILIQNHNNIIMIDTGGNTSFDIAEEVLIPFLRKKNIYKIDALIITHNDKDHSGGVSSLMNNFKVNRFLSNKDDFPLKIGDIYLDNLNNYSSNDENDKSLVFNLSFLNKKFLLMGDAGKNVENYLINNNFDIDCDILKVGHHGSETSTSEKFLKKVTPYEAVISVGEKNSYNHPSYKVISMLEKYNINIRRTDKEGTIKYC